MKSYDYTIQSVQVLSRGEQVAYVVTPAGDFVVSPIPAAFTDARDASILKRVHGYNEAVQYCRRLSGSER
jgi:hypothetical protein